jgi:hypothetical protein
VSQPQSDHDPLLDFSSEPGAEPAPEPAPPEPGEPVAAPIVAAAAAVNEAAAAEVERLRERVNQLEKSVALSAKELRAMRSEVATLVARKADIRKPARRVALPLASAVAGITIGLAGGIWFWTSASTEPVAPIAAAPIVSKSEPPPEPAPAAVVESNPAPAPAPSQPAIVHAAAITRVSDTPARVAPERERPAAPARVDYVGTLSIDSDPGGEVFIDRKAAGKTPMRAENLKAGSHLVWIERDGYQRFTRVVLVPSGKVTRLVADLEPAQH